MYPPVSGNGLTNRFLPFVLFSPSVLSFFLAGSLTVRGMDGWIGYPYDRVGIRILTGV
jgi:hypothetical protein